MGYVVMTERKQAIIQVLDGRSGRIQRLGAAFAPANIALSKYWGKRNERLNLPLTGSLSISLGKLGTRTCVSPAATTRVFLNDQEQPSTSTFARRVIEFVELLCPETHLQIRTWNTVPTAAGAASSASGFAALTLALNAAAEWQLPTSALSLLARLGSGSAARSVIHGFAEWLPGDRPDGSDSLAIPLNSIWPEFRIGLLLIHSGPKATGSRVAMRRCRLTSPLFAAWPGTCIADLQTLRVAIKNQDFSTLGACAEANALAMHAVMLAARPSICYWQPDTLAQLQRVQQLRRDGLAVYATIDAGPNLKLLFTEQNESAVLTAFPECKLIRPFAPDAPHPGEIPFPLPREKPSYNQ